MAQPAVPHSNPFLNREQDDRIDTLLEAVKTLERIKYPSNYSDYVKKKEKCLQFRITAKEKTTFIKPAE